MITRLFTRTALHEHADPAQRILAVAELAPDSPELARLLAADPVADVRSAAAARSANLPALMAAWDKETDPQVRAAVVASLAEALAHTASAEDAAAFLAAEHCGDEIRIATARRAQDSDRRRAALDAVRDESLLRELALNAEHAETRMAAAARIVTPDELRKLAEAAKNRDHGVARLARQRVEAFENRVEQERKADAVLDELEALATRSGPILTAVVELNRRWQAIDVGADAARLARVDTARQAIQARFDREQEEQRTRARFERKLREWLAALAPPADGEALVTLKSDVATLRDEAAAIGDATAPAKLDDALRRIAAWEREHHAQAGAEALVVEAEQLAAGTSIDNAKLPERWQMLDRAIRTAAMTRRFEAAMIVIEQRRLAQVQVAQQEVSAQRARVHALLHTAEQALAAGQLQAARAAADEIKALKTSAGMLPKPTTQRLGRLVQQLGEMERWESFGQQNARVQLCERAEALAAQPMEAARLAQDVQKLRAEWKALDAQHAGVPKALWERFDGACEKAYAPAARHFAEVAGQRKQARKQRDDFISAAAAHAPTLLTESPDWRAIERWLRETDTTWREGSLGSVEPAQWKKFDARLKEALAPLRDAMSAAREQAKAGRRALIEEATALAAKANDRDAPSQVKAIQLRWQEQAKALSLPQRDERTLWEQFRAACDAVFTARNAKRKEDDERRHQGRRELEETCAALEALAASGKDPQELRRAARELQEQWKKQGGMLDSTPNGLVNRFRNARTAIDAALTQQSRSREAAVWQNLAMRERLCEALDTLVRDEADAATAAARAADIDAQWTGLPPGTPAWDKPMSARRDAALAALADANAAAAHRARIASAAAARAETLLELEMLLGQNSPPEFQSQRLALQVKQLRDRFQSAATAGGKSAPERLLAWCASPGVADARDRQRIERIFSVIATAR
jgi:hypothetical protein